MTDDNIIERLKRLDVCAVSDTLDSLGMKGVALGLRKGWPCGLIAGRTMTVKLVAVGHEAISKRHLCTGAIMDADPGDVIVVDNRGRIDAAGWGGILSLAAKQRGLAGVIVDGACRDIDEATELEFPVFAKEFIPLTARGRIVEQSYGELVEVCGVSVSQADYVIADGSGVAFIPADRAEEVVSKAEGIVAHEKAMAQAVRDGRPVSEVMGESYETLLQNAADR